MFTFKRKGVQNEWRKQETSYTVEQIANNRGEDVNCAKVNPQPEAKRIQA